jgi:very-short-patch-repair endonuclease
LAPERKLRGFFFSPLPAPQGEGQREGRGGWPRHWGSAILGLRLHETNRARALPRAQTEAERLLWRRLRPRGLGGFKFVRQEPIGLYFADFVCREAKLIVEVDGATHSTDDEIRRNDRRAVFLRARGYRIARFANDEIYGNLDGAMETILAAIDGRSSLEGARG